MEGVVLKVTTTMRQTIGQWLRWSEKYLKTDMLYLAKGGGWLGLGQLVAMASGFILSLAFAHFFSKESFGTYKFILSVAGVISIFSLSELATAVIQSVSRGYNGALRQGFYISLRWSIGVFLAGLVLGIYYFFKNNLVLSYSFIIVGLALPVASSGSLYAAYLLGKKDFRRNSLYGMLHTALPATALVGTVLWSQNLYLIMTVYFLVGALAPLFLYYLTLKTYRNEIQEIDPGLTSYGGHLSLMEIIGKLAAFLDKILIFHYLGPTSLAIYSFALAPVEQLQSGKKILGTLLLPKLGERSFENLQQSGPRKALMLVVYALVLAGVYIILAPYFYGFFYPQYIGSVVYSQVYSLTLLAITGTVFNETLIAHKRKKELYLHRIVIPVVQITLFFVLLPRLGLWGLIITHVFMRSFSSVFAYYLVRHPFK